jgi:pyruvate/2-oxoglutarate/acetoin dehydrogenase E1 component
MAVVTYAEALARALEESIAADDRVALIGNNFGGLTPEQRHFDALGARHPDRVDHTPWSELANAGMAIGAAAVGLRPVVDMVTASFVFQAFPQIVNEAPNIAYTTAGRTRAPAVFHMLAGLRGAGASQHPHRPQAMFWNTPGLHVAVPGTPSDAYGLMRHYLLEGDAPCAFVSHAKLLEVEQEISDWEAERLAPGRGRIERAGADLTVVASSVMVPRSLEAAAALAAEHGIDCEVLNLRTLAPFDDELVAASVTRTGRVVVADEGFRSAGAGAEIVARVAEAHFGALRAAPRRVVAPDVPVPFSPVLEAAVTPSAEHVIAAVVETCA